MHEKSCEFCGDAFSPISDHPNTIAYFKKRRFCSARCAGKATKPKGDVLARFWGYVDKRGVDECWEWIGARQRAGYGALNIDGKIVAMHRFSWQLHNGPIPPGAEIMHSCDNPPCVNPRHLSPGTHADNMKDAHEKGKGFASEYRRAFGEGHGQAKLTEQDVLYIRSSTDTEAALAIRFGVSGTAVGDARRRKTWKHIP